MKRIVAIVLLVVLLLSSCGVATLLLFAREQRENSQVEQNRYAPDLGNAIGYSFKQEMSDFNIYF